MDENFFVPNNYTDLLCYCKRLKKADKESLLQYELMGNGTGVSWCLLDEDLNLKGFLSDELLNVAKNSKGVIM